MSRTRHRQTQIPGTERKEHPEVEEAADALLDNELARKGLAAEKEDLMAELVAAMQRHGITVTVIIEAETKVKVRKAATSKRARSASDEGPAN